MEPRSHTDSETLDTKMILQEMQKKIDKSMKALEKNFFHLAGWRSELAKEYYLALSNFLSKWDTALNDSDNSVQTLSATGLYKQILILQKIIDDFETKVYQVMGNDFYFVNKTIDPLKKQLDKLMSMPAISVAIAESYTVAAERELEDRYNINAAQSAAANHFAAALTLLNKNMTILPKEALDIQNQCTKGLINILRNKSALAEFGKEKTLALIESLPAKDKLILLEESLNKTTSLGQLFWKKEGWKSCSLTSGSLKKIQEAYDKLSADYLNTACKAFMTNLSDQAFKIPKGETIDSIQKINALNFIKRYIVDNQINQINKIQLLHAALNPYTELGIIFWKKRGQTEPNLDSGTLKELQSLLHEQQANLPPTHYTRSSTYSGSMGVFPPPNQSTTPSTSLSAPPGATNQNENTTPEKTTANESKIHGPGHR